MFSTSGFLQLAVAGSAFAASVAMAADQVRIVGSSTVYPFSSYVAEELGATTDSATPVVESTGSGGGFKLFCDGVDAGTPDITNASRRMKSSEFELCMSNGVTDITEAIIGFDGIVIGQHKTDEAINFSLEDLAMAVVAEIPKDGKLVPNPYRKWNDINSAYPDREIKFYGPPTSSGTRDAFEELVLEKATKGMEVYGEDGYMKIRDDGVYIPSGENDNLIVQKLQKDRDAFGIFGYSFLEENADKISGATIAGTEPGFDAISSGDYPISRSLFFYTKNAHMETVKGMKPYVDLFISSKMIGQKGLLKRIGLVPLPRDKYDDVAEAVKSGKKLAMSDLK